MRLWNGRIGRWLTTDPYGQYFSPYLGMGNNPMNGVDADGGCWDENGNPCADGVNGQIGGVDNEWIFGEQGWDLRDQSNAIDLGTSYKISANFTFAFKQFTFSTDFFALNSGTRGDFLDARDAAINRLNDGLKVAGMGSAVALYGLQTVPFSGATLNRTGALKSGITYSPTLVAPAPAGRFSNLSELYPTHAITKSRSAFKELLTDIKVKGQVTESIKYVVHNGKKYIVDGHHRFKIANGLGLKNVPTQQVNLPYAGYKSVKDLVFEGRNPGYLNYIKY